MRDAFDAAVIARRVMERDNMIDSAQRLTVAQEWIEGVMHDSAPVESGDPFPCRVPAGATVERSIADQLGPVQDTDILIPVEETVNVDDLLRVTLASGETKTFRVISPGDFRSHYVFKRIGVTQVVAKDTSSA